MPVDLESNSGSQPSLAGAFLVVPFYRVVLSHRRTRPRGIDNRQKIVISGAFLLLPAVMVLSALDYRFGWSGVSTAVSAVRAALVAIGLGLSQLVVIQNGYAAANITVEAQQQVASTGLYGLARHPMYLGVLIMLVGTPLALGSYWVCSP